MPVTYTSYKSAVMQTAITMLEASVTFQGIVSAAPGGLAVADCILESMGGLNPAPNATITTAKAISGHSFSFPPAVQPFVIVQTHDLETEHVALATLAYHGDVTFQVFSLMVSGDQPYEILRRARNISSGIASDIDALQGTGTSYFYRCHSTVGEDLYTDQTTDEAGYCVSTITTHWNSI